VIHLNDPGFDILIKDLQPHVVLYDRFMIEEQYGWRVREHSPESFHILDTVDLHFLRNARELALKINGPLKLFNETAMREIAAMYRCDFSIIISQVECNILKDNFQLPASKIIYIPFLYHLSKKEETLNNKILYNNRSHMVMIGNSLHTPNYDAIVHLKKHIWPTIKKLLPAAQVHIYGAYQTQKIKQLHNKKQGFIIRGFADDAIETISNYRLLLAPLRFGAGLKGKIFDAMQASTPAAMTRIAAEGMFINAPIYGFIEDDPIRYAQKCVALYQSPQDWNQICKLNAQILEEVYEYSAFAKALLEKVSNLSKPKEIEKTNFFTAMLNFHAHNRYKYMSKWITLKNANNA
jgi:glycosyltransferase involved in cell wall biosynthesis